MNDPPCAVGKLAPEDTAIELRCVVAIPLVKLLTERYGPEETERILAETGMNTRYLMNGNNWISYAYFCRLLAKVVRQTNNPEAPYEAARAYSTLASWRTIAFFLKRLGTPGDVFRLMAQFSTLWTKVNTWRMERVGRDSAVVKVAFDRYKQDRNNCLAIQGSLAAVPVPFGLPYAQVEELACACDGAPACLYRVRWQNRHARGWALGLALATVVCGAGVTALSGAWGQTGFLVTSLAGFIAFLVGREIDHRRLAREFSRENAEQAAVLLESIQAVEELNRKLQDRVEERTAELRKANDQLAEALQNLRTSHAKRILAERQAAIGVLAAGMAHELNSPLNAVKLYAQNLIEDLPNDNPLHATTQNLYRSASRCQRIVRELLAFARDPCLDAGARIEDIVLAAVNIFRKETPDTLTIDTRVESGIPNLALDRMQIQQAILNLLNNAAEAMNGRGIIEIRLASDRFGVLLSVTDHGPGIAEAVRPHLFDPFCGTKKSGKGLGLGLCITYQLVTKNNGTIEVVSREGAGATFTLRFPMPTSERNVAAEGDA